MRPSKAHGFFVVQGPDGSIEYTRAGNFQTDENGNLETATGQVVQGWTQVNGVLNTNAPPGNITIPTGTVQPPVVTQNMSLSLNLDAAATPGSAAATFATSVTVYDSLGNSHVVTATFTEDPTVAGQWDYSLSIPATDFASGTSTPLTGSINFNSRRRFDDARRNRSLAPIGDYRLGGRCGRYDRELEPL